MHVRIRSTSRVVDWGVHTALPTSHAAALVRRRCRPAQPGAHAGPGASDGAGRRGRCAAAACKTGAGPLFRGQGGAETAGVEPVVVSQPDGAAQAVRYSRGGHKEPGKREARAATGASGRPTEKRAAAGARLSRWAVRAARAPTRTSPKCRCAGVSWNRAPAAARRPTRRHRV